MKEFNKHNLIEALASLGEFEPKDKLWDKIAQDLDDHPVDQPLQECIAQLPSHEPPAFVWENIEKGLNIPQRTGLLKVAYKWQYGIAAGFAILIFAMAWLRGDSNAVITSEDSELAYSVEVVDDNLLKHDWNEDEDGFAYIMDICKERKFACDNPEFKSLQLELEELNDAKEELESAIGAFGTNEDLIAQMREIEFARTDIVKKMIDRV